MIACSVQKVSKTYGGNMIFEDISLEIYENDRVGFVGRNGSGKTTLFRLMAGMETPDEGQIHWRKGTDVGYLAQIPDFPAEMSVKEVLKTAFSQLINTEVKLKEVEAILSDGASLNEKELQRQMELYGELQEQFTNSGGYEIESNIDRIANGLKIESLLNNPFSLLSGGEKTKVGLGLILLKEPNLLFLDEPTNHLDLNAVEWLGSFLKEYKGTVVVISHDRYFLDEIANKILDLEDGELNIYHTNYSGFVKEKEERLLREFQQYEEQQKKIKKMKEAIKRLKEWANRANPPNAGLHKRARNMERALERMEKLNRPTINAKKINLELEASNRSGKDVVYMKEISKAYGNRPLFTKVNLHLQYKDHAAIIGENGTGKSTLLKIILGQEQGDSGEVKVGSNVKVGYLSQHIFANHDEETVLEAFRNEVEVAEGDARHILAKFLFYGHAVFQRVNELSGGERMRLRLAQLMHTDINFLILDEPTNHLDIESREVLEESLEDYKGTILAVSHDRYFLNKLFSKIYWIKNEAVHYFPGNYEWAKKKLNEKLHSNAELQGKEKSKAIISNNNKREKKISKPDKAIEKLEHELEELERLIENVEKKMLNESNLADLQRLFVEKENLERKQERLYEELEELL